MCGHRTHCLFRSQILSGAHHHPNRGQVSLSGGVGNPEVREFYHPVRADHDVRGLYVAVNNPCLGSSVEGECGLTEDGNQFLRAQTFTLANVIRQGLTRHQLHDDPPLTITFTRIENCGDIGVVGFHGVARFNA